MKILFVGTSLSPDFEKLLFVSGFEFDFCKSLDEAEKKGVGEMVVLKYSAGLQTADLESFGQKNPETYIATIIAAKDLKNKALHNSLLSVNAKHSVWLLESWETLFWFNLQSFFQWKILRNQNHELHQNFINLEARTQQLTESTNQLIDQFEKDISVAESIQRSLLPKTSPEIPGISMAVKYLPSGGLGGDYYDIFEFGDKKRVGILVADSKTHGMAAALLGILLKIRLEELKERFPNSKAFVTHLNQELAATAGGAKAPLNLLYGILDRSTLQFSYTTAGDIQPLLWRAGNLDSPTPLAQPPLGSVNSFDFEQSSLQLFPGDLLLLHTDGLQAPFHSTGKDLEDRLRQILNEIDSNDALKIQNELLALLNSTTQELPDDVTFIQIAVKEKTLYLAQSK